MYTGTTMETRHATPPTYRERRPEELAVQTNVQMVPTMNKHHMYTSRPRDSRPDTTTLYEARKPEETGTQVGTPTLPVMDTLMYPCTPTGTSPPYYGGIHELDHNGKAHMQKYQHETDGNLNYLMEYLTGQPPNSEKNTR